MKTMRILTLAAASAVLACGFAAAPLMAHDPKDDRKIDLPAGEVEAKQQIVTVLANATDRAFNGKGLGSVLELVAKADRERIGQTLDRAENEQFVAAADRVARMWREKYNHNFDASENTQAMQNLGIERSKDDQGRDRATVQFPAQGGRSRFEIRLVREGTNDWRILLPDDVTPNNFGGRMAKSMDLIAAQAEKEKWPENRSDAYLNVTSQALHTLASETDRSASGRD